MADEGLLDGGPAGSRDLLALAQRGGERGRGRRVSGLPGAGGVVAGDGDAGLTNLPGGTIDSMGLFQQRPPDGIVPVLGPRKLDQLTVRDVRSWLNGLRDTCQCCAQEKDKRRVNPKCCAVGHCCRQVASERTIPDAWTVLRAALNNAVREELISRNVAALVRVAKPRRRKVKPWSVDEARKFLESTRKAADPLYAAYVLILVLGLRRGEVLGLRWEDVDFPSSELTIGWQIQPVDRQLLHRQTKTEASDAPLPIVPICEVALRERHTAHDRDKRAAGAGWHVSGLVFTTRTGRPVEPRNFNRSFTAPCSRAGVRAIPVHATRKTCASLLVALDVHPRAAMQVLRHSQISVTMNIYSEVSSEATRRALKRLGRQLGGK